jgi:hypothetical protein
MEVNVADTLPNEQYKKALGYDSSEQVPLHFAGIMMLIYDIIVKR